MECISDLDAREDHDPERGWRVIAKVRIRGEDALVVPYPEDLGADVWRLGSAYFTQR
ncbi:MAG: hypothetical protein ACRDOK_02120 [Streptosporangiaceae bacterium]